MSENVIITGRLVSGHPMNRQLVTDKFDKPVLDPVTQQQKTSAYFGMAIPKAGSTDWKTTVWGQQFVAAAVAGWTNGEQLSPTFAWKVVDGDSPVPNQKGNKPCDQEGWPGHWIVKASTMLTVQCNHADKLDAMEQIADKGEIKCGDYGRALLEVKANNPSQSPGIYINPSRFCLDRPGEVIVVKGGMTASEAFGAAAPVTPPATPAVPAPLPATDILAGPPPPAEKSYVLNGATFTETALRAQGYTNDHFATMTLAL